jgi:SdrD B-like domain
MSQKSCQTNLGPQTQQLLQGPLKRVKAAGLALALVPLAAVVATTAEPQLCSSAGMVCGTVWQDTNNNGLQEPDEPGIENAIVTLGDVSKATNEFGYYEFSVPYGEYKIAVQIPPGTQPSPSNTGNDDTVDSDGVPDGVGNSTATATYESPEPNDATTDFGFWTPPVEQPGTGTPGYWKNHPEAWPVDAITIGGVSYTRAQAIEILEKPGKDRTLTMFSSLVPAKLNVLIGNDGSCVEGTIAAADEWMHTVGPVGSGVHPASLAWKVGEPMHRQLDNYNNGMLCAPHRE